MENVADLEADSSAPSRYTDKAGFEKHVGSSRFKELVKQAQEEELTSKPIEIKFLSEIGGFHKR